MPQVHPHDESWVNQKLSSIPERFHKHLLADYLKAKTRFDANTNLRVKYEQVQLALGYGNRHDPLTHWSEQDLESEVDVCISICQQHYATIKEFGVMDTYHQLRLFIESKRIAPPPLKKSSYKRLCKSEFNDSDVELLYGFFNRALSPDWWRPKLRKRITRENDICARALNLVSKKRACYVSDLTVSSYKARQSQQQRLLEGLIATNEEGYSATLAELSAKNVSDPKIRKAELMTRISGFEECAKQVDHCAIFITMTAPSRFHRTHAKSGGENANWKGETPIDGQHYLNTTFQRVRAELGREEIFPYGFRIAEPHHDGTPHWHLLLFLPKEQQNDLIRIFKEYCLQENGDEKGASKRRVDFELIDPNKGSATGYLVKYISKNIDGSGLEKEDDQASEKALRVRAWASCYGIRQFQQLGGIGVTQWRELRRLNEIKGKALNWLEKIRDAADKGDWLEYTLRMGGLRCKRKDQKLRPLYQRKKCIETGDYKQSRYGDKLTEVLKGIKGHSIEIITRVHEWRVERGRRQLSTHLDLCK